MSFVCGAVCVRLIFGFRLLSSCMVLVGVFSVSPSAAVGVAHQAEESNLWTAQGARPEVGLVVVLVPGLVLRCFPQDTISTFFPGASYTEATGSHVAAAVLPNPTLNSSSHQPAPCVSFTHVQSGQGHAREDTIVV